MTVNTPYLLRLLTTVAMYVVLGMGLNVTLGLAGLLDMGYVGFYAIGAYAYSLLSSPQLGLHLPLAVTLPASALAAVALSLAIGIPTLRLHGDYLAIVTMGFAEIVRIMLVNLDRPLNITNGPNGIIRVDPLSIGRYSAASPLANFVVISTVAVAAYAVYVGLARSKTGLRWRALKDDPLAASSLGINTSLYRVLAFATGSLFAGTAGALFAAWQGAVFPQNFTLNELIVLYCMVVLGGAGNPVGTVAGAAALVLVPELLRGYSVYRMLIYGAFLVVTMIYKPRGLISGGPPAAHIRNHLCPFSVGKGGVTQAETPPATDMQSPSEGPVLSAKNITVRFGGVTALTDVSLDLHRGEVLSVIGPNGAGKTTLVNVLTGVTPPDRGSVCLEGEPVTGLKPHRLHRLGLSRTFQNNRLFGSLTVAENLEVPGGALPQELTGGLEPLLGTLASSLSYGHRKALEMSRALVGNPKVVLLDEPAAGVNPAGIERITRRIRALKSVGYSVIVVEHRMPLVMAVSDRVLVLDRGEVLAQGTPSEVAANPKVAEVYLGTRTAVTAAAQPKPVGAKPSQPATSPGLPADPSAETCPYSVPVLELRNVHAGYGTVKVLHGVNLSVKKGEIACVLGNNGAGKSTMLKAVLGMAQVEQGNVLLDGKEITGTPAESLSRMRVAAVPENRRLFSKMTVSENLAMGARPGMDRESVASSKETVLELFPALKRRLTQKAGTLSGGEQQMLAVGRALMSEPSLILLDEPSMGLAPVIIQRIVDVLRDLNRAGLTVLMVEQNVGLAVEICTSAHILNGGTVTAHGSPDFIVRDASLMRAYLGYAADQS